MQPHVGTARLLAVGKRELVLISVQVPQLMKSGCRSVRDDGSIGSVAQALRSHPLGIEPEPCCAEFQVLNACRSAERIHAVREPDQDAVILQTSELDARHSRPPRLRGRQQTPLPLGEVHNQALKGTSVHTAIVSD